MRALGTHIRPSAALLVLLFLLQLPSPGAVRIDPRSAQERRQRLQPPPGDRRRHRDLRNKNQPIPNVDVLVPTGPDDHEVAALPLFRDAAGTTALPVRQWAGHLPASADGDKYLFYWLFAPDPGNATTFAVDPGDDVPLLIWLNGGPGCSSMDGLFVENGPLRFVLNEDSQYVLTSNPYAWNTAPAYTLYIDQPVGTGLSFTTSRKYPTNDPEVNADFYYFLTEFLRLHADKFAAATSAASAPRRVRRPVFFSGESHAGHYIPSMMHYILRRNDDTAAPPEFHIPLRGAAIGNGWTDPFYQYAAAEAAYGHGLLDRPQVNALDALERQCQEALARGDFSVSVCFSLLDKVVAQSQGSGSDYSVSTYDARLTEKRGGGRDYPVGHKAVETYLGDWPESAGAIAGWDAAGGNDAVLAALHATAAAAAGQRYRECTDPPYDALADLDGQGVVPDVVAVLEHPDAIRLLFFNGMEDLICNHVGNEMFLINMQWSGQQEWVKALRYVWRAAAEKPDKVSGYMKEYKNLLFLKLLNAGHMVPLDLPQQSLEMMQTFMYGRNFDQSVQNIDPQQKQDSCPVCPQSKCETCEECSTPRTDDDGAPPSSPSTSFFQSGSSLVKVPWVIAAVTTLLSVILLIRNRKSPRQHDELISQYDLELREGNYRDHHQVRQEREIM